MNIKYTRYVYHLHETAPPIHVPPICAPSATFSANPAPCCPSLATCVHVHEGTAVTGLSSQMYHTARIAGAHWQTFNNHMYMYKHSGKAVSLFVTKSMTVCVFSVHSTVWGQQTCNHVCILTHVSQDLEYSHIFRHTLTGARNDYYTEAYKLLRMDINILINVLTEILDWLRQAPIR